MRLADAAGRCVQPQAVSRQTVYAATGCPNKPHGSGHNLQACCVTSLAGPHMAQGVSDSQLCYARLINKPNSHTVASPHWRNSSPIAPNAMTCSDKQGLQWHPLHVDAEPRVRLPIFQQDQYTMAGLVDRYSISINASACAAENKPHMRQYI